MPPPLAACFPASQYRTRKIGLSDHSRSSMDLLRLPIYPFLTLSWKVRIVNVASRCKAHSRTGVFPPARDQSKARRTPLERSSSRAPCVSNFMQVKAVFREADIEQTISRKSDLRSSPRSSRDGRVLLCTILQVHGLATILPFKKCSSRRDNTYLNLEQFLANF